MNVISEVLTFDSIEIGGTQTVMTLQDLADYSLVDCFFVFVQEEIQRSAE
jgi:hypothetical protein